jgi:hypothetical protein
MISSQKSMIAILALALTFPGVAVTGVRAQTQIEANAPTAPNAEIVNPLEVHPLNRFSATRERPLFAPNRRPPAPPPAPIITTPPPQVPNLVLLGVVIDAGDASAIVKVGPASETLRVRIGDDISGWKVTQIEARQLVLSQDSRVATFTMFSAQQ